MERTFDHNEAINGALIFCGDQDLTDRMYFSRDHKVWCGPELFEWDMNGKPFGGYPELTTKPEGDESSN